MAAGAVVYAVRALREKIADQSGEAEPGRDAIERVAAMGDRLRTLASFRSGPGGWSGGTHACLVEVDVETGIVEILRYVVVDDCGAIINPAIVAGQVRGGVAMGVGFALLEDAGYDEDGNPSSTLVDYLLPTAVEVPAIELEHVESELLHELDYRGVGEGGTIAAPPALVNAIADAVGGIDAVRLPLTPERVLELVDRG
jgi:carbon-monoxide dehydrogenase large subunit